MSTRKQKSAPGAALKPTRKPAPYQVGYGKPPLHTQFQKGTSGNPSGRPPRAATERVKALALKEAYRSVTLRDGERVVSVPAIQAVLRSQLASAVKGNVAQRAFLEAVQAIELENVQAEAARAAKEAAKGPFNYIDAARRVAFLLKLGEWQEKEQAAAAAGEPPPEGAHELRNVEARRLERERR
jgi:Family of unknown function (DUF5681)